MSVGVLERPATGSAPEPTTGGVPARRAMIRWAWRLFKREWRQQLLILLLVVVAVAAVVVGSAVAVNTPPPANAGFGTADDLATFTSTPGQRAAPTQSALGGRPDRRAGAPLRHRPGHRERDVQRPGQRPRPTNSGPRTRTAPTAGRCSSCCPGTIRPGRTRSPLTPGLASELNLQVGDTWPLGGKTVVGIVQNPQSLLDEFALVPPGQVTNPTQVDVLFDAPGVDPGRIGSNVSTPATVANSNPINPDDHRAGVGDGRHAADRAGVDRRLHRAGAAPDARPRDARVHGGDGPQRPARAGGQRRHRRGRGRRRGLRAGPGGLAGLPPDTTSRARTTSSRCSPCRGT